jgi:hypothetical protein
MERIGDEIAVDSHVFEQGQVATFMHRAQTVQGRNYKTPTARSTYMRRLRKLKAQTVTAKKRWMKKSKTSGERHEIMRKGVDQQQGAQRQKDSRGCPKSGDRSQRERYQA